MKTRFILHGGFKKGEKQENDPFFKEILSTAPQRTTVLLVYFAKEDDRVDKNKKEDIEQFNKNSEGKSLVFEVANESSFVKQLEKADVIYLHGGHTGKLLEGLKKFPSLKDLLKGKIVAGDSAGANVLCSAFYSLRIGAHKGLGIIPIKIICHYIKENKNKLNDLLPHVETLFLPDYQFTIYEI